MKTFYTRNVISFLNSKVLFASISIILHLLPVLSDDDTFILFEDIEKLKNLSNENITIFREIKTIIEEEEKKNKELVEKKSIATQIENMLNKECQNVLNVINKKLKANSKEMEIARILLEKEYCCGLFDAKISDLLSVQNDLLRFSKDTIDDTEKYDLFMNYVTEKKYCAFFEFNNVYKVNQCSISESPLVSCNSVRSKLRETVLNQIAIFEILRKYSKCSCDCNCKLKNESNK